VSSRSYFGNTPKGKSEMIVSRLSGGEAPWDMLSLKAAINHAEAGRHPAVAAGWEGWWSACEARVLYFLNVVVYGYLESCFFHSDSELRWWIYAEWEGGSDVRSPDQIRKTEFWCLIERT